MTRRTAPIPYDAVALAANETGTSEILTPKFDMTDSSVNGVSATNLDGIIFPGDRISFSDQEHEETIYVVYSVSGTNFVLTSAFSGDASNPNPLSATGTRHYGGRGDTSTSRVHCHDDSSNTPVLCSTARVQHSGSMQSKIEDLTDLVINGVMVDRDGPDADGGFIWRITFLDDAPDGASDFAVAVGDMTQLKCKNGAGNCQVEIAGAPLVDGETYTQCSGTLQVPKSGGLVKGTDYYTRVSAVNGEGYSLTQSASTVATPSVVPGAPTGVTVKVNSATELLVNFSPPSDNGGDAITKYLIEWDTSSAFTSPQSEELTHLAAGASPFKKISSLTTGTYYFIRVSAYNVNGYGATQATTPSSLNPHQTPSAPTNVVLSTTSNTMLTVSFGAPSSDGGDTVSEYRIEWDTANGFNSGSLSPHKDSVTVSATAHTSYTITSLSSSTSYFVRVAAVNSAGVGTYKTTTPASTLPSIQVPGTPHSLTAVTGTNGGEIVVTWQRPRVPHHGYPCSGTTAAPNDCPTPIGGSVSASDGGVAITEYEVEWNEQSNFGGSDGSSVNVAGVTTKTITGLVEGRIYYVRVLARNTVGSGGFCEKGGNDICDGTAVSAVAKTS
jgi:hypothetical protein